jgi:CheY-like chemotaxis protein
MAACTALGGRVSLRAVVVDDEAPARAKLRRYLAESDHVQWIGEAANGRDAVALIRRERPDVVFLDISMPGMDGFAVLQALGDPLPAEIVFVTAHDDQAVRAFEVHAFDYLLKPVGPERFARALERLRDKVVPALGIAGRVDGLLSDAPARHAIWNACYCRAATRPNWSVSSASTGSNRTATTSMPMWTVSRTGCAARWMPCRHACNPGISRA